MDVSPVAGNAAHRRVWSTPLLGFVVGVLLGSAGAWWVAGFRTPESTPAWRGKAVADRLGCFACHGPEGRGGVADPGSRNGLIPGWDGPTVATLAKDEAEVREWILDGIPARLRAVEAVARGAPVVPMPAYRGLINDSELEDLMAYFRAVSLFGVEVPEPAYEGWKVADQLGCFGCHGPGGTGGMPNPGSFKGHIPAWDGEDFADLVRDDAELMEWIMNGYPQRLWDHPIARRFLEGQVIGMPAYRAHLSAADEARLLAYFQWLRQQGADTSSSEDSHRILGLIGRLPLSP